MTIQYEQLHEFEGNPNRLSVEASDLRLPPGDFPTELVVQKGDAKWRFHRREMLRSGEEFAGYRYYNQDGPGILTVFND